MKSTEIEKISFVKKYGKYLAALLLALVAVMAFPVSAKADQNNEEAVTLDLQGTRYYNMAFEILDIVNENRAKEGVSELVMDELLLEGAMERAEEQAVFFSHTRPDGTSCFTKWEEKNIESTHNGENIAANSSTSQQVMERWMNSEGHRSNILNADYTRLGVGVFKHEGIIYWVQMFSNGTAIQAKEHGNVNTVASINVIPSNLGPASLQIDLEAKAGKSGTAKLYVKNSGWGYVAFSPVSAEVGLFSSKTDVVKVDASGSLKAVGAGKATIRAFLKDLPSVADSETIEISRGEAKMSFSSSRIVKSCSSTAFTIAPKYTGNGAISYTSSNSKVAAVDKATGKVTIKGVGTATITASAPKTAAYTAVSAKYTLEVNPAMPKLTAVTSAGYDKVKITWAKAKGAAGYYVYRKSGNSWKKIATVKSSVTSYTNSSLTCGNTYTYTVKAYVVRNKKTYISGYDSKGISGKPMLTTPKLGKLSKKSGSSLKLTWSKVSGASGYAVYRKEASGKYVKIKTITKGSTVSFTDKKLKKGTKYTYTVKAYRRVNGKNIYSFGNEAGLSATLK